MSIEEEIAQKREEQRIKQEQLENERISRLAEAEKEIPAIAETIKNKVVQEAASGKVERRLFSKRKFVRTYAIFNADSVLRKYPELHAPLIHRLNEMGMSAVEITVRSQSGPNSVYVYVEYNLK